MNDLKERPFAQMKALVLDDEPEDIAGTLRLLKLNGLHYVTVKNVADAERMLREESFDVMVVDIRLPLEAGGELHEDAGTRFLDRLQAGELGERNLDTYFIVISAQNRSVHKHQINKRDRCWGIYGKLMHNRIIADFGKLARRLEKDKTQ